MIDFPYFVGRATKVSFPERILNITSACFTFSSENFILEAAPLAACCTETWAILHKPGITDGHACSTPRDREDKKNIAQLTAEFQWYS